MTYGEMNNYITHVSDNDLVALCKSVYELKNGNGELEPISTLKILAENLQFSNVRDCKLFQTIIQMQMVCQKLRDMRLLVTDGRLM